MTRRTVVAILLLVAVSVVVGVAASDGVQLVAVFLASLLAAALVRDRSMELGPPRPSWGLVVLAVVVAGLVTVPLLRYASIGIAAAVLLTGLVLLSRRSHRTRR